MLVDRLTTMYYPRVIYNQWKGCSPPSLFTVTCVLTLVFFLHIGCLVLGPPRFFPTLVSCHRSNLTRLFLCEEGTSVALLWDPLLLSDSSPPPYNPLKCRPTNKGSSNLNPTGDVSVQVLIWVSELQSSLPDLVVDSDKSSSFTLQRRIVCRTTVKTPGLGLSEYGQKDSTKKPG